MSSLGGEPLPRLLPLKFWVSRLGRHSGYWSSGVESTRSGLQGFALSVTSDWSAGSLDLYRPFTGPSTHLDI